MSTRVRFAPSPTGFLHIGGLRTALYDYLFAKASKGRFILRIEDTDRKRFVDGAIENLIDSLTQLGLDIDEGPGIGGEYGPYIQSERLALYQRHANELLESGHAYRCFCSAETLDQMRAEQQQNKQFVKYDRRCLALSAEQIEANIASGMPHTIRLKMPDDHKFAFNDEIRGAVEMDASQSDDQVIVKSDGFPTYHLAAVVDDHYMQITHVIRGEEWLSSTPKHVWLYQCLGWDAPIWVHLPLILNPDRTKLSKRMNDVSVMSYIEKGYLKEALLNFIALLGWHSADDRELYSIEELCQEFSLDRVNKAGAVFDLTKLDWMNGQYLRSLPLETIAERSVPYFTRFGYDVSDRTKLQKIVEVARERSTLLPELAEYAKMFYEYSDLPAAEQEMLKSEPSQMVLKWFHTRMKDISPLSKEKVAEAVQAGMTELGIKGKNYYTPLRLALIRQQHGPDIPSIFDILGDEEAIRRLVVALI